MDDRDLPPMPAHMPADTAEQMRDYARKALMKYADLLAFADHMIGYALDESCDFDTQLDILDIAENHGLLNYVTMAGPCGEDCSCAEKSASFPTSCYRKTYRLPVDLPSCQTWTQGEIDWVTAKGNELAAKVKPAPVAPDDAYGPDWEAA